MEITEKKCRLVDKIIEVLVEEKCTVEDAQEVLEGASREIRRSSTVQIGQKLSTIYYG